MSAISQNDIRNILMKGDKNKYSHVVIVCDEWDYEDFPVFVTYEKDVNDVINKYSKNMHRVMEVYNYNLDLEMQLNERRAYHINPIIKKEDIIDNNPVSEDEIKESEIVKKALEFATIKHKGQYRKFNNLEYITHPIETVEILKKYKKSHEIDNLKAAMYLHDTIENTDTNYYELLHEFGYLVAGLVMELTTNKDMQREMGKDKYLAFKLKSMTDWALDLKLCDRFSNINDLDNENVSEEFRNKYINETLYILLYLINNRKLTHTHNCIIRDMILKIKEIIKVTSVDIKNHNFIRLELTFQKKLANS